MKREDIKIKHCFWRTSEGKCLSPEAYRFIPDPDKCPYNPEETAFYEYLNPPLRCLEFRHDEKKLNASSRGK